MAKKTIDPKDAGGTAVVEDEVYEVPVLDTEDEELLGQAAHDEPVQGADEGEEATEAREEAERAEAKKAEPEKKPKAA